MTIVKLICRVKVKIFLNLKIIILKINFLLLSIPILNRIIYIYPTSQPDPNKSYVNPISKHTVNSYGIYVKSDYPEIYKPQYFSYVGDYAAKKYVKEIIKIFKNITYNIYLKEQGKPILSKQTRK